MTTHPYPILVSKLATLVLVVAEIDLPVEDPSVFGAEDFEVSGRIVAACPCRARIIFSIALRRLMRRFEEYLAPAEDMLENIVLLRAVQRALEGLASAVALLCIVVFWYRWKDRWKIYHVDGRIRDAAMVRMSFGNQRSIVQRLTTSSSYSVRRRALA